MSEPIDIFSVIICKKHRKMYMPTEGKNIDEMLPCGCMPSKWIVSSALIDDLECEELVDWADKNGHLDLVFEELEEAGGSFDYGRVGANFIAPDPNRENDDD